MGGDLETMTPQTSERTPSTGERGVSQSSADAAATSIISEMNHAAFPTFASGASTTAVASALAWGRQASAILGTTIDEQQRELKPIVKVITLLEGQEAFLEILELYGPGSRGPQRARL